MASPRALIAPPAFTPHAYGLLTAATDVTATAPSHWEAGVTWQPLCAEAGVTFDGCLLVTGVGEAPEPEAKSATFDSGRRAASPFTVYARKDCSVPTFWNGAEAEVSEGLTEGEGWQVERAFWSGAAGGAAGAVHPHLAADTEIVAFGDMLQSEATIVTGTAVDLVEGLGRLEAALGDCYQGQGVIHVPAVLGPQLAASMLAIPRGGRLYTPSGNLIALGSGYPGTAPDGSTTAGQTWIYATGAVFYARSPIRTISSTASLDRADNTLSQLAERTYVIGWDCCHLAIPVSTGGEAGGAFNTPGAFDAAGGGGSGPGGAPVAHETSITRFASSGTGATAPGTYTIASGTRTSYAFAVAAAASSASPTLNGVALPAMTAVAYTAPQGDTLGAITLVTVAGDDVTVTEIS